MTTVVNTDGGADSGFGMALLAIILAAVVGLGVWFFCAQGGSVPKSNTINITAPSTPPAVSIPMPSNPMPSVPVESK